VTVEASVTEIIDAPEPALFAEGQLMVDDLPIYHIQDFGIRLIPVHDAEPGKAGASQ
jgi:hypothetical protein